MEEEAVWRNGECLAFQTVSHTVLYIAHHTYCIVHCTQHILYCTLHTTHTCYPVICYVHMHPCVPQATDALHTSHTVHPALFTCMHIRSALLVWIGSSLLSHVIFCCVTEVETPNGHLKRVLSWEAHPAIRQGRGHATFPQLWSDTCYQNNNSSSLFVKSLE